MISPLHLKVITAFWIIALVPLVILAQFNYRTTKRALTNSAHRTLFAAASETALRLDDFVAGNLGVISAEAQLPRLAEYLTLPAHKRRDDQERRRVLDILRTFTKKDAVFISSYGLLDLNGLNVIDTDGSRTGGNESSRDYFRVALETGLACVSAVEFAPGDGKACLCFSSVVHAATGKPVGVLRARHSAAILQQLVVQTSGLIGPQSYPVLLDENGLFLADGFSTPNSPSSLLFKSAVALDPARVAELQAVRRLPLQPLDTLLAQVPGMEDSLVRANSPAPYFTVQRPATGLGLLAAAAVRMNSRPWFVAFLEPQRTHLSPVRALARNTVLLAGVIALIVAIAAIAAARVLTNPIVHLTGVARQVTGGNLAAKAQVESKDEIGVLAQAFNSMTDKLQASIVSLGQRVAELNRSNQALRESEDKFNRAFMLGPDLISIYRMNDGKYIDANDNLIKISGYCRDEVIGKTTEEIRIWGDPDAREPFITKLEDKGEVNNYETNFRIKDGSLIPCLVSARPIEIKGEKCIISIARDISERKRAEAKERLFEAHLQQSRKMEAVGVLAGGIAHEFNNALAVVVGNIELLQLGLPDHENVLKFGHDTKTAVRRMSYLTNQLLAYARGGKYRPENINLSDFVSNTLEILQHDVDPAINIETDFSNNNFHVNADLTQLQTVLSVIVTNAKEAIEGKGQIRVTTGDIVFGDENVGAFIGLKAGKYTYLSIEDNGRGMDDETKNRIFEPFFTTKFQGRGLGMAAVYGIVKNHDGYIYIDSEPGKGTAIRIFLPSVEIVEKEAKSTEPELRLGSGTVLVIEDEEMVLDVTQTMLEKLGYRVLCARTGKEAIGITNTFDGDIDLALLDIKLPDMEGGRIYPIIKEYRPKMKVIVCSGYSSDGPAREILNAGAHGFIKKPFVFKELFIKIRSLLEGK
jgi:PAS domain S-box-containing protein